MTAKDEHLTTCWLIRAGEDSRLARSFAAANAVVLGWTNVDGLGDLRGMSDDSIRSALQAAPKITAAAQDTAELIAFRDDVQRGDIVITPDARTREVLVGEITGDYDYRDPSPIDDYHHVRDVTWYSRFERDELSEPLAKDTNWRRTLRKPGHQDEWLAIAARAKAGEGRPPTATGQPSAKVKAKKRPDPADAPTRMCSGCGFAKTVSQFEAGSDLCVDCR